MRLSEVDIELGAKALALSNLGVLEVTRFSSPQEIEDEWYRAQDNFWCEDDPGFLSREEDSWNVRLLDTDIFGPEQSYLWHLRLLDLAPCVFINLSSAECEEYRLQLEIIHAVPEEDRKNLIVPVRSSRI